MDLNYSKIYMNLNIFFKENIIFEHNFFLKLCTHVSQNTYLKHVSLYERNRVTTRLQTSKNPHVWA